MKASNKFIVALTALLTVAGINTASAQLDPVPPPSAREGKIYPGNACQPILGSQNVHFMFHKWGIRTLEKSPNPLWVTCPIVRDNTLNDNGLWTLNSTLTESVLVRVFNTSEGKKLECQLVSLSKFSIDKAWDTANTVQPGNQELGLSVRKSEPGGGAYALICSLPPGAKLFNYWVREYTPTDPN